MSIHIEKNKINPEQSIRVADVMRQSKKPHIYFYENFWRFRYYLWDVKSFEKVNIARNYIDKKNKLILNSVPRPY